MMKDARYYLQTSSGIWDWDRYKHRFEVFRKSVEGHYEQIGSGYLLDSSSQEAYLERGIDFYFDFLYEVPSTSQIKKVARALLSSCQSGVGCRISMENRNKQDGIRSWCRFVQQYETDGNRNVRIKRLESVINTVFHRNYRGRLVKWIQDYEDAFTELALLGQKTWNDDEITKR
jgi:ribosomal protein L21E